MSLQLLPNLYITNLIFLPSSGRKCIHIMQSLYDSSVHLSSSHEDILMKKILQTHAPDGRQIDSVPLLRLAQNLIRYITIARSNVKATNVDRRRNIELASAHKELACTIHDISREILRNDLRDRSSHETTMVVLGMLGGHSWDAKVVIVLAVLAMSYGEFWLIMKNYSTNPLALSIAMLKGLTRNSEISKAFQCRFKAISYLVEAMVDATECLIEFQSLSEQYMTLDYKAMAAMKTQIHIAAYWVIRSAVACTSQITSLIAMKSQQVHKNSISLAWELWSSASKVTHMRHVLWNQLNAFYLQIEKVLYSTLLHLFDEAHADNQKVLSTLFALKDDLPLRDGSSEGKLGVVLLRNKVVVLFISRPNIPIEKLLLLMQQMQNYPHNKQERCYEILWVPIAHSIPWSRVEERAFSEIVQTFPWYSLNKPTALCSSVIKFIQEVWHFQDEPLMVVLDAKGKVTSLNAADMVAIWGALAYPFSGSREKELWEATNWTLELIMDEIDPLVSYWMRDGRIICLYGSSNLEWIRELTNKMKHIIEAGVLIELVYVGSNCSEHTRDILTIINEERLSGYISYTNICIFWLRLKSMSSSKERLGNDTKYNVIMREICSLLSIDTDKGWLIASQVPSTDVLNLFGNEVLECLSLFHIWGENVNKLGFLGAIRKALDPTSMMEHCNHYIIFPYVDDTEKGILLCEKCKCLMEKHIMYQCCVTGY